MRTLDVDLSNAIDDDITRPYFLIEMDFDTPVRYSTVENITWDTKTWTAAGVTVSLTTTPTITVFNENKTFGNTVLIDGTAGRSVNIYQGYQNDADHPAPILIFSGEMGDATIGQYVSIRCKRHAPARSPVYTVSAPTFNHVPPVGTKFETPTQIIILEGD